MKEIVNVSKNWAIGRNGSLMINITEDMKYFRETTKGKVCIMGSRTLESFPNMYPLPNRVNIVLIDDDIKIRKESLEGLKKDVDAGKKTELIYVHSKEEALEKASIYPTDDVFVIGGASIYKLFLDVCDTCLVTHNDLSDDGADTYYPDLLSTNEWKLVNKSEEHEFNSIHFAFCEYQRIK